MLQSNALATVTTHCLIVRSAEARLQTIIPIAHVAGIRTAKTTYPGLLVIAAGCWLIAGAAYCSKQEEGGAALPAGILGVLFLLAYIAYQRVSVSFFTRADETITCDGTTGEAAALIKAVKRVQAMETAWESSETGSDT